MHQYASFYNLHHKEQNNLLQVKKTHEMGILCQAIVMINTFNDDRDVDGLINWPHIVFTVQGSPLFWNQERECLFFVEAIFIARV